MPEETHSFSPKKWARRLSESEERRCEVYRLEPNRLIADYRSERGITRGYHGREILELLQNAGDAACELEQAGRVHISLSSQGLVLANTGKPFDSGGVDSLMTANLSPKRKKQAVIGDKGLGFRSILNWTDEPLISSGELGLGYFDEYASEILNSLMEELELKRLVEEERQHAQGLILARLAFPKWIPDWQNENWPNGDGVRHIADQVFELRQKDFDTVIGMPFTAKDAYGEARKQLDDLRPEILIFVDSIESLVIEDKEEQTSDDWSSTRLGDTISVHSGNDPLGCWRVFSDKETVPPEFADPKQSAPNDYEITVAIPVADADTKQPCLFCYFPTDVELPLISVCHATLGLNSARKHLINTPTNRFILARLADCLGKAAERITQTSLSDPWSGCDVMCPRERLNNELRELGFEDALKEAVARRTIVPGLNGDFRSSTGLRRLDGTNVDWLPARHFADIAATGCKRHQKICQFIGIEKLANKEVVRRLREIEDLTIEERADAIVGLLKLRVPDQLLSSALLVDQNGEPVSDDRQVILEAREKLPAIPDWARIRFLHKELRELIQKKLEIKEVRELQRKLKAFGVIEFSLANLIVPVVAEADRCWKAKEDCPESLWSEVLVWLLNIYRTYPDKRSLFPSENRLRLRNQEANYVKPSELYLSQGCGLAGKINQALYGGWGSEKLVAPLDQIGLEAEPEEAAEFLQWIGVAKWPREVLLENPKAAYVNYVGKSLSYPAKFDNEVIDSPGDLQRSTIRRGKTIDKLETILSSAPFVAILAWLYHYDQVPVWKKKSKVWGVLAGRSKKSRKDKENSQPVPGFVHWCISQTQWLPTTEGKKVAPTDCLLGEQSIESLFPRPAVPDTEKAQEFGLDGRKLLTAFQNAGVAAGLAHLSKEDLYRLLLKMPTCLRDGKAARGLYRWLLQNDHILYGRTGELYREFLESGRMWGSKNGESRYIAIKELRHVDSDGLPEVVLKQICLVDLPRRSGADKVKRIFGVESIERLAIQHSVISRQKNPHSDRHAENFNAAKPYIRKLRQSQSLRAEYLNTFEKLELCLCDELMARLRYEESESEYSASKWEWVIDEDVIYIRTDCEADEDLLTDTLGAALASVFRIADGDGFARLIRCKDSSRNELLRKMCGDSFDEEIEAAHKNHQINSVYQEPIEDSEYREPKEPPAKLADENADSNTGDDAGNDDSTETILVVEKRKHVPTDGARPRRIVVKKTTGLRKTGAVLMRVTDGALCERKAKEFERSGTPKRYPLPVDHITGFEAPGVDILSFKSHSDREKFKNPKTQDFALVDRFIEVKGRSNPSAKIELKGNELKKAQEEGARYYIYRVFQNEEGFHIATLRNPLACDEAITPVVCVDLDRANSTERYLMSEVEIENT